jgi:iron complex transport system substrate-binding protein
LRIVSLLPSATDIVGSLGLAETSLVGRTHECDWPPGIEEVPVMTRDLLDTSAMSSREIHEAVGTAVHSGSSIYALDRAALSAARPDLILTQELCEVCAVSYRDVAVAARAIDGYPRVVSLEPHEIEDILTHVELVGRLTGMEEEGLKVAEDARGRLQATSGAVAGRPRPRVFCVEWLDPIFDAGHWVPDQVARAGGSEVVGRLGEPSRQVAWDRVVAADPEVIVVMPCGVSPERAIAETEILRGLPGWGDLSAVAADEVWAVDGPSYFNRPGPRVVRGVEILASIFHPEAVAGPREGAVRIA